MPLSYRDVRIRKASQDALQEALDAAVAGIGLRGRMARKAMVQALQQSRATHRDERWSRILAQSRQSLARRAIEADRQSIIDQGDDAS